MLAERVHDEPTGRIGLAWALMVALVLSTTLYAGAQTDGDMATAGRRVFVEKGCVQCHAIFGEGGKVGPDLGKQKFYGSYIDLAGMMWNHFPKMWAAMQKKRLPQAALTSDEMAQLVAYLLSMRYRGEPGNEFRGRKLLRSKRCLSCHKLGGVGGDLGPDFSKIKEYVSPLRLAESMWNHGPKMLKTSSERKVKWPKISGSEIVDIAAAIRASMAPTTVPAGSFRLGDPARGRQLLKEKGCLTCHAIRGEGGKVGPDFASLELRYSVTELAGRMWNHGPAMWKAMQQTGVQPPTFQQGELANILAALYQIRLNDVPGTQERGRAVLEKKKCLSCHSLHGKGGETAPDLAEVKGLDSPLEMVTAMWNHAPKMREMVVRKKLPWPKFGENEMGSLYVYLRAERQQAQVRTP